MKQLIQLESQHPRRRCLSNDGPTITQEPESDVLTLMQAAVLLKCHSKTLRLTAIGRKIPSKRVGSHWRFYRPKLEAWLKEDS